MGPLQESFLAMLSIRLSVNFALEMVNMYVSRTIFKMLAPIIGCSLIKGPWRSSIFAVVGRLIMVMSPLWTGDTCYQMTVDILVISIRTKSESGSQCLLWIGPLYSLVFESSASFSLCPLYLGWKENMELPPFFLSTENCVKDFSRSLLLLLKEFR